MVFDPNAQNRRFGEIAQAANPQASDPNQNRNLGGFPGGRRFSYMNNRLQKPGAGATAAPPVVAPTTQPVIGTPGTAPTAHVGAPAPPSPGVPPQDMSKELELANAAQAARNKETGLGNYGGGTYAPPADDAQWSGEGYSGADPRASAAAPPAETTAAPPPGAAGGKGGQMANANDAMTSAGFTPPGGAGGGKGGGESPVPVDTAPADPESPIVPPGDIGNTGTDPDDPINYDGTGSYDDDTGFSPPFESRYAIQSGGKPGQVLGHENNPEAKARLQKIADRRLKEWTDAGGDPKNFITFNPEKNQFKGLVPGWAEMTPEQKWGARQTERGNFYDKQIAALRNSSKPGVK